MSIDMKYAICKLPEEDDDIINVCISWLTDNDAKTYYPPKSQLGSLKKMLANELVPQSNWKTYPVEVMQYYETLDKAEGKMRKACDTSNLESSDEEEQKKTRNKRRKKDLGEEFNFQEECSDTRSLLPKNSPPMSAKSPPHPSFSNFQPFQKPKSKLLPKPVSSSLSCSFFKDITPLSPNEIRTPSPQSNLQPNRSTPPSNLYSKENHESRTPSPQSYFQPNRSTIQLTPLSHHQYKENQRPTAFRPIENVPSSTIVVDRTVLSQIQLTLADICQNQKKMREDLEVLKRRNFSEEKTENSVNFSDLFGHLPVQTIEEFKEFEDSLDERLGKQLIKLLTSIGGNDLQHVINNMLRRAMTDQLAMEFSFSGKAMAGVSKAAFCKTKIYKCILVAAQKTFSVEQATETKVGVLVGKWLQQAKPRVERREASKKKVEKTEREEGEGDDGNNLLFD